MTTRPYCGRTGKARPILVKTCDTRTDERRVARTSVAMSKAARVGQLCLGAFSLGFSDRRPRRALLPSRTSSALPEPVLTGRRNDDDGPVEGMPLSRIPID